MKYRVGINYEIGGFIEVEADSAEEAEKIMKKVMDEEGIEDEGKLDVVHRDYLVTHVEELPKV